MRTVLFSTAVIAGVVWAGVTKAGPQPMPAIGDSNVQVAPVEKVGYWRRRYYRRHEYGYPYAYYPPAYGYYPPAYGYYPPRYPYYYGYRYYQPYYAPY